MELVALIGALPAATQATAGSLPNNQHYCKKEREREREKKKESRDRYYYDVVKLAGTWPDH